MTGFASGRELSARFYHEAVRPVLDATSPGLPHSAALLGRGSEVLGFDDEMSADHDWDARVLVFLCEKDQARHGDALDDALRARLPARFADHPTKYEIHTLRGYFLTHLGFDLDDELEAHDWLTFPEERLRMFTAGAVHHDDVGLQAVRDRFAYYPHDVWLYLLLAGWWRIHPEANLVGRTGYVGDELGSAIIGAQLVHDLMALCFLMERQYAPYSKWFGTAFSKLACGAGLSPVLTRALRAVSWPERQEALAVAYESVAAMHNALGVTEPVSTEVHQLWNRPFEVVWGDFPGALRTRITDPAVDRIARRWPVGRIDQVRDLLPVPRHRQELLRLYEEPDER
ncbi:DUF4037 domain-containing protein [Actinopolymorpha singaporensis]